MTVQFRHTRNSLIVSLVILLVSVFLQSCTKDEEKPEILGCNKFKYNGVVYDWTYMPLHAGRCSEGVAAFTVTEPNGLTFHVKCRAGCMESITVSKGQSMNTIAGP